MRATCELYLKLEKTLLQFEPAFREAEERAARRRSTAEQLSIINRITHTQPAEPTFMESVQKTSMTLTSALDETSEDTIVAAKHQAIVLEKLAVAPETEEEF